MGLSSKQVSEDIHYWPQGGLEFPKPDVGEEKQSAPLRKCPRCESTNTKFCYYNNYSRSQPRHFCRVCRRHWTQGGTLRNIPVGGGRKNKRRKITSTARNPTAPALGELKGTIFPNILRQVPHFQTALAAEHSKVDALSSLFGASLPNASLTFTEDFNRVSSYSCQYNWNGAQDVGSGCENGVVGLMGASTESIWVNKETFFPASYWDFWDGGAVDFNDGGSVETVVL